MGGKVRYNYFTGRRNGGPKHSSEAFVLDDHGSRVDTVLSHGSTCIPVISQYSYSAEQQEMVAPLIVTWNGTWPLDDTHGFNGKPGILCRGTRRCRPQRKLDGAVLC